MKNLKYCLIKSINKNAPLVVIPSFENNGQEIFNKTRKITKEEFSLLLVYNLNWNDDLSPYFAKSIFDNAPDFKGEADNFLNYLTNTLISKVCNENEINPSYFMLVRPTRPENTGNHFQDESLRIAKCIKYLLEN